MDRRVRKRAAKSKFTGFIHRMLATSKLYTYIINNICEEMKMLINDNKTKNNLLPLTRHCSCFKSSSFKEQLTVNRGIIKYILILIKQQ